MENSFTSYRNDSGTKSGSESDEIIDNSFVSNSFGLKNKLLLSGKKNRTVYIAPSDSDDSEDNSEDIKDDSPKSVYKRRRSNSPVNSHVVESSEEEEDLDKSRQGSLRRSFNASTKVVLSSSSDDEEVSPEIVPRRRPTKKSSDNRSSDSPLIRRVVRKRIVLTDSENDNSIILENDKHNKITCLKDTPLKLEEGFKKNVKAVKMIDDNDDDSETGDENQKSADKASESDQAGQSELVTSDEGPDEDEMVMSRATRMSIMGVMPKDLSSDESDFIQSDDTNSLRGSTHSLRGSTNSLNEPTAYNPPKSSISVPTTPPKSPNIEIDDADNSRISCSTFGSPVHNTSVDVDLTDDYEPKHQKDRVQNDSSKKNGRSNLSKDMVRNDVSKNNVLHDLTNIKGQSDLSNIKGQSDLSKGKVLNNMLDSSSEKTDNSKSSKYMIVYDDDVTMIINNEPEVIALSSDDDDEAIAKEKSPKITKEKSPRTSTSKPKKSPSRSPGDKPKVSPTESYDLTGQGSMHQFLKPPSYPNQGMVFVKRSVKEKEMSKLNQLKEDVFNVRHLLENMDVSTLPDGGAKLFERLEGLERQVRAQGDLVANMVAQEDEGPADAVHPNGKPMTWEEIQKASNQVQPKMFGKQAMATHMAERSLILDRLGELHASLDSRPPETSKSDPPRGLKTELMGHQSHALAWLKWRETQRPRGGILADDMGLGKTITMISLMCCDQESKIEDQDDDDEDSGSDSGWNSKGKSKGARGGTLVVCPASLLQQWAEEVTKHCKASTLSVTLHHGASRATQPHRLTSSDLVVTTYNILQRDSEKNGVLMKITWHRVILDEAHIVRNYKAATSVAVSRLKAVRRWALTGTPVQNKDLDVFALLKFLRCTPFDDLVMWKKWIDNKSLGGQERLNMIMSCILLRRTKQQLQAKGQLDCLPDRRLQEIEVKLTTQEMNVYQKVLVFSKTLFAQFLHQRADKQQEMGDFNAKKKNEAFDKMHRKMVALQGAKPVKSHEILVLLLRLRQICCHCGLIASMLDEDAGQREEDQGSVDLLNELNKLSIDDAADKNKRRSKNRDDDDDEGNTQEESTSVREAIRSVLSPNNPVFNLQHMSSKIRAVLDCLQDNVFRHPGEKAVVVSQWTSVLRLVETQLNNARIKCVSLTGAVAVAARAQLVNNINDPHSSVKVMLLSLCAGGVGLNLCGANHLLLLDPHWNPQLEQQAQDRIYRVGQKKDVKIYKFICVETVEQSIRKLQEAKLDLADNILTGAKNTNNSKLTIEDLKTLFNM